MVLRQPFQVQATRPQETASMENGGMLLHAALIESKKLFHKGEDADSMLRARDCGEGCYEMKTRCLHELAALTISCIRSSQ